MASGQLISWALSFLICDLGIAQLSLLLFSPQEWPEIWGESSEVWSDSGVKAQPGVREAQGYWCLPGQSHVTLDNKP